MPLPDLRSIRYRHISPDARSLTKPPRIRDISHPRPGHSTPRFTAIRGLPRCAYRVYRASPLLQSTRPPLHHYDGRAPGKTISKHQPSRLMLDKFQLTLRQACSRPKPRAQYAFKDSMIHGILQFTLRIAFRCVLHRCESQDIRC